MPTALHRDGCALLPRLVDPALLTPLATEVAGLFRTWGLARRRGDTLTWTGAPFDRYDRVALHDLPAFHALVTQLERGTQPWQGIGDRMLGRRAHVRRAPTVFAGLTDDPAYQLPPHQDGFRPTDDGRPQLRVWLPLFRIPFGDGGLGLLPGSHTRGYLPAGETGAYRSRPGPGEPGPGEPVPAIEVTEPMHTAAMHRGDALLFDYRTVHCGLPARSDGIRVAVALSVTADRPGLVKSFHPKEIADRAALVRAAAGDRDATAALVDLNVAGLDATPEHIADALAGRHSGWRHRTP